MAERMNPKNDFVFQMIFGQEENKEILLGFLNATFNAPPDQKLTAIQVLKTNLNKKNLTEKSCVLDICAKTAAGVLINIEVQLVNHYNMEKRTLYYWSRLYTNQLSAGEDYRILNKTITINILDFEYLPLALYHSVFQLKEKQTNQLLTDALEIHFIELPKLCKTDQTCEDPLVNWMLFLEGPSDQTLEVLAMKDPAIRKAWTVLELLSQDEEARRLYEMREKALHDEISMMNGVRTEASAESRSQTQREIASNLLLAGVDISIITNTTGLTEAEVIALKQ